MQKRLSQFVIPNAENTGKVLGKGLGEVHEYICDGVSLAGKFINESLVKANTQYARDKYFEECTLMSKLRHPNIVQFAGVVFHAASAIPVILMEKLEVDLKRLFNHIPNITLSLKVSIYADIARGLAYLHSLVIVHRGIEPQNILLDGTFTAKITGFRWARFVEFQSDDLTATLTRNPSTSPEYLPPDGTEQDHSCKYGPPLDVFSLGHLILYVSIQVCYSLF